MAITNQDRVGKAMELLRAEVTVVLKVEARLPGGASDQVVRTVTENSRTLKFTSHGFERSR